VHRVIMGKTEGKSPLGIPRRRWEVDIKMDLREVGGVETGRNWLRLGTDGGTFEYGNEISVSIKCW